MPSLIFAEAGSDASFGLEFYSTSGTVTSDSGTPHTGLRSIKLDSGAGNAAATITRASAPLGNTRRISFWFRSETLPGTAVTILDLRNTIAQFRLQLRTDGTIRLLNSAGGDGGTSVTTVSAATWTRLSIAFSVTATSTNEIRVYLNGTQIITASNVTFSSNAANQILIGWSAAPGANRVMYVDDLYVDDGTYTDGDTGDMRVTVKLPAAAGAANAFDTLGGSATNRWDYVNERPWSDTNFIEHAGTSNVSENFTLQAAAVGDVDITGKTIIGRVAYIRASKSAAGGTSAAKITNNGTDTAVALATSTGQFTNVVTDSAYPSNAAGIGLTSTTVAADAFLYDCGMMIVYNNALNARGMAASSTATASRTLKPKRTFSAGSTLSAAVVKKAHAIRSAALSAAMARVLEVRLTRATGATATASRVLKPKLYRAATVTATASRVLRVGRHVSVTVSIAVSRAIKAARSLAATATASLSRMLRVGRHVSVTVSGSGSIARRLQLLRTAAPTLAASVVKRVGLHMQADGLLSAIIALVQHGQAARGHATGAVSQVGTALGAVRVKDRAGSSVTLRGDADGSVT